VAGEGHNVHEFTHGLKEVKKKALKSWGDICIMSIQIITNFIIIILIILFFIYFKQNMHY